MTTSVESVECRLMDVVLIVTSQAMIVLFLQASANMCFICMDSVVIVVDNRHCIEKWIHTPESKAQCPMDRQLWGKYISKILNLLQ